MDVDQCADLDINRIIKYVGKGHTIGWTAKKVGATTQQVGDALLAFGRLQQVAKTNGGEEPDGESIKDTHTDLTKDEEEELKAIGVLDGKTEQCKWLAHRGWSTSEIARKLGIRYQQVYRAVGRR